MVDTMEHIGTGVNIYIIDSGIRVTHRTFQGRAVNFRGLDWSPYADGETADDTIGHGTLVAGIAGGFFYVSVQGDNQSPRLVTSL